MEKAAVEAMLVTIFDAMGTDVENESRDPDFQAEIRSRVSASRAGRHCGRCSAPFPNRRPSRLRRLVGEGDVWVAEATSDYGERRFHTVVILEMEGDLILRETRYYTEPFEAPEWREAWVESIPES